MRASVKARVVLGWTAATIVLSCISMDSHASEQFAKRHMVPKYAQFVAGNEAGVEKPVLELRDSMPVLWIMYNLHIYLWLLAVIFTVGFAWTEFESEEFRLDRVLKNQGDLFA